MFGDLKIKSRCLPKAAVGVSMMLGGLASLTIGCDNKPILGNSLAAVAPVLGPNIPADIANPADPAQAAQFAWQEFVAVTWPAKVNPDPASSGFFRGQPSPTQASGATGAGGVTVWETFYHRNELYPSYMTLSGNVLPDPNATPNYNYGPRVNITAAPGASLTLFNNADETSEITIANMYFTPLAKAADALVKANPNPSPAVAQQILNAQIKAGIVYEAKGNPVIFNYLKGTGFNNLGLLTPQPTQRRGAMAQAVNRFNNLPVTGTDFRLPNGALEIKATWRRYDASTDNLGNFHWSKLIYYTKSASGGMVANNDIFVLIGLHIIQKTPNVPTFTFATFEHVSNEQNGFRFINAGAQSFKPPKPPGMRLLPDPGIITAARQYAIPGAGSAFNLVAYNSAMQAQLRSQFGAGNVWANYQLIGVQAVVANDPGGAVPPQQFFLSNFATETNNTLQFFQGGLTGGGLVPGPNTAHVFKFNGTKYVPYTAGGCLGCHGSQGQFPGGDFSVIAANGNRFMPEAVTPYPGGPVFAQNPTGFPLPH